MKRLHISLTVEDFEPSIQFYTTLFGAEPTVRKPNYAKWMLDDPRVNFVITTRCGEKGIDHLGIQAEDRDKLCGVFGRLKSAEHP